MSVDVESGSWNFGCSPCPFVDHHIPELGGRRDVPWESTSYSVRVSIKLNLASGEKLTLPIPTTAIGSNCSLMGFSAHPSK
jgi:hypothetical protein